MKGWTDAVYDYLKLDKPKYKGGITRYAIPHEVLLDLWDLGLIPDSKLGDSQNGAPTLDNFIHELNVVAVSGYIVPKDREDERITIDGCVVESGHNASFVLSHGVNPDTIEATEDGNIYMWWD